MPYIFYYYRTVSSVFVGIPYFDVILQIKPGIVHICGIFSSLNGNVLHSQQSILVQVQPKFSKKFPVVENYFFTASTDKSFLLIKEPDGPS